MWTEKVTCDACGKDLTTRSNSVAYRLALDSERMPGCGSFVSTGMMISPPVERTHHFCDFPCLDHWRNHHRHYDKLRRERWEQWKVNHGDGRSYLWAPQDVTDEWDAECRAAAHRPCPALRSSGAKSAICRAGEGWYLAWS